MNTATRFGILIIAVLVLAGVILGPRAGEWFAILREQGKQAQLISLLEPQLSREPNNMVVLSTLARAYSESRKYERALELMERYVRLSPENAEGYARLSELYGKVGNRSRAIDMLATSIRISPNLPRALELAALYRRAGRTEEESAVLGQFEGALTVQSGAPLRLAELRSAGGDRDGAIRALERPEVVSGTNITPQQTEARLVLARLLFDAGQHSDAVRFGEGWVRQWREAWLANRLLHIAALHGSIDDSLRLADVVMELHPEIRLYLVRDFGRIAGGAVARHLLETWGAANPSPTQNEIAAFLSGCREQDAADIAWQTYATLLAQTNSTDVILAFTNAMVATFGIGALAPFWQQLPPAVLQREPLLLAQLTFHQGNLQLTKWFLAKADLQSLSKSDRQVWSELLIAVGSPSETLAEVPQR